MEGPAWWGNVVPIAPFFPPKGSSLNALQGVAENDFDIRSVRRISERVGHNDVSAPVIFDRREALTPPQFTGDGAMRQCP